jgi:hypothetical protein
MSGGTWRDGYATVRGTLRSRSDAFALAIDSSLRTSAQAALEGAAL